MKDVIGLVVIIYLIIISFFIFSAFNAKSHSWYDPDCCGINDCGPVKILVDAGGNYAVLKNGQKWYILNPKSIRPSQDDNYHVCIYMNQVWCLYVPTGS